ncbi:MAG: ABC transporter ATP-binding protein [Candidatus Omnitrophota bacterium]|nr:MAG: ABC transporter ATP-binding protein [Candidatus Omnitrophota bacterium]
MIHSVTLKNIVKIYNPGLFSLKVDKLNLTNDRIHVINGPNGSGKSTLLNLISTIEKPDKGSVLFNNEPLNGLGKKIGVLMQKHYLFNLTVFENVALGLKLRNYPRSKITPAVTKMMQKLKISHLSDRGVKTLSGGERRRVSIAQILVLTPRILLMDEPTSNIDAQNIFAIEEAIKQIHKKFAPLTIITTHCLNQAFRLSSNIISITDGKITDFLHENVFFGEATKTNEGLKTIKIAKDKEVSFITEKQGNIYIAIDPQNIIISKNIVPTSARNHLCGTVEKAEFCGPCVRLLIDVGAPLYATITRQSFKELGINLGATVCASFKVNSVKVL